MIDVSRETCGAAPGAMTPITNTAVKAAFDVYAPRVSRPIV